MRRVFHPFAPFVGLRYVRARTHKFFVSFITWVSLLGVGLGVAALIVILSVMNGFEGELRDQLLALSAHARVVPVSGAAAPDQAGWDALAARLRARPGVTGVAPYVEVQALAVHQPDMLPVVLRGIDPAAEGSVSDIAKVLHEGALKDLVRGEDRVLVGDAIARQLGIEERTVKAHVGRLMRKTGADNRIELTMRVMNRPLVPHTHPHGRNGAHGSPPSADAQGAGD